MATGAEYIMEASFAVGWFRDETVEPNSSHFGELRPIAASLRGWYEEGCLSQTVEWDVRSQEYILKGGARYCYTGLLDAGQNPAAFANDALFGKVCGEEDPALYWEEDSKENAMLMIPCARRTADGTGRVEFSSVWFYPRSLWTWPNSEVEVTVGYWWALSEYSQSRLMQS